MVINYQEVINGCYGLLMVISQLLMVINGCQGLSVSYQWLSMVTRGY